MATDPLLFTRNLESRVLIGVASGRGSKMPTPCAFKSLLPTGLPVGRTGPSDPTKEETVAEDFVEHKTS